MNQSRRPLQTWLVKQDLEARSSIPAPSALPCKSANGTSQYAAEALSWNSSVNIGKQYVMSQVAGTEQRIACCRSDRPPEHGGRGQLRPALRRLPHRCRRQHRSEALQVHELRPRVQLVPGEERGLPADFFYKDISNYIVNATQARLETDYTLPGTPKETYEISGPTNGGSAKSYGASLSYQQTFSNGLGFTVVLHRDAHEPRERRSAFLLEEPAEHQPVL